ncbi:conjugative transfer system coupling protein TraD [Flavobacterium sp.]|uniref:conjugative transfer system coupling protein TraD n=1 Tax=Flavobacterium sp. TaxID=239 RepID=UPI0026054248|nr:conjugative transfer system coupling protein TraD [Flavobacterium sp.]
MKDWFRPLFELRSAVFWLIATFYILIASLPFKLFFIPICVGALIVRLWQSHKMIAFRVNLWSRYLVKIAVADFYKKAKDARLKECFYMGEGFQWDSNCAGVSNSILALGRDEIPKPPNFLPEKFIEKVYIGDEKILDRSPIDIGKPWVKALGKHEPVLWPLKATEGHTLIEGTTGSGKTRCYEMISTQIIHSGKNSVLFIIDPKNDQEWLARAERECRIAGKKFLYFKLADPSQSIRFNTLASWNQPSEIATRVSQLVEEGPFRAFAHLFIDRVVNGLLYLGVRPSLANIFRYLEGNVDRLLEQCLEKYFLEHGITDFRQRSNSLVSASMKISPLEGMYQLYKSILTEAEKLDDTSKINAAIEGLGATFTHSREHYGKITANLLPLLQMLAKGEVGLMLSPDVDDLNDQREIWDTQSVIEHGAVIYVGMDSLSNVEVSKAVNSMMLADIASFAGHIYNTVPEKNRKKVYLMIDEVAEAINEQVIQILNKGRGAGFVAFVALQSIKDLEAKLGDSSKMYQTLGNLNNQITLRLEDTQTVDWIVQKIGETRIKTLDISYSQGTGSEKHPFDFSGTKTKRETTEKGFLVPPEIITGLPNLQYIARFSGGSTFMGTIPIISNE